MDLKRYFGRDLEIGCSINIAELKNFSPYDIVPREKGQAYRNGEVILIVGPEPINENGEYEIIDILDGNSPEIAGMPPGYLAMLQNRS